MSASHERFSIFIRNIFHKNIDKSPTLFFFRVSHRRPNKYATFVITLIQRSPLKRLLYDFLFRSNLRSFSYWHIKTICYICLIFMPAISSVKLMKWKKLLIKPFHWNKEMIDVKLGFILFAFVLEFLS